MDKRRVVITGLGTVNPLGNDVDSTWQAVRAGRSGIGPITSFDASEHKTQIAGEVRDFDALELFGKREARRMDRVAHFALAAADQAIKDAGFTITEDNKADIGVVLGSGVGGIGAIVDNMDVLQSRGIRWISPFFVPMMLADTAPGMISIWYGFRGPNMAIATACASGNNAIGEAARMVQRGAAEIMLTGGCEAALYPVTIAGFNNMGALSTRNDEPQRACRPFDSTRDGFVPSEGAAILVLEALDHALARGARIYGEFLGYGTSADAFHISAPHENGEGAILAMRRALEDAGVPPVAIGYINAHGTSTPLNDASETAAIKQVLGEHAYDVAISSTKSMHGHLLGATSALEALISIKALNDGLLPPTINYEHPDPECDLDYVPNAARPRDFQAFMSNGFGFGGHNAVIVVGRHENGAG